MKKITSNDALYRVEDLLNRSFVEFVLLGKTAKTIVDGFATDLNDEDDITLGVMRRHYTKSGASILKALLPRNTDYSDNKIEFKFIDCDTNIVIKIIDRKYDFFKHPDMAVHKISDFRVPNPFNKYWKTRNLIQ